VTDRKKMEGSCSTGQSPQWAVVPVEEEEVYYVHVYKMRVKCLYQSIIVKCRRSEIPMLYPTNLTSRIST
jgi:hypothetical protein